MLKLDLATAAAADEVTDTVHYGELAERLITGDHGRPGQPDRDPGAAARRHLRPQLGQLGNAEPAPQAALDEVAEEAESAHPNQRRIVSALTKVAELAVPANARLAVEFVRYRLREWGVLPPPSGSLPPAS